VSVISRCSPVQTVRRGSWLEALRHATPLHATPLYSIPLHFTSLYATPCHATLRHDVSRQRQVDDVFVSFFSLFLLPVEFTSTHIRVSYTWKIYTLRRSRSLRCAARASSRRHVRTKEREREKKWEERKKEREREREEQRRKNPRNPGSRGSRTETYQRPCVSVITIVFVSQKVSTYVRGLAIAHYDWCLFNILISRNYDTRRDKKEKERKGDKEKKRWLDARFWCNFVSTRTEWNSLLFIYLREIDNLWKKCTHCNFTGRDYGDELYTISLIRGAKGVFFALDDKLQIFLFVLFYLLHAMIIWSTLTI